MRLYSEYFYGNKASDYAIEHGRLDYCTLAKAFNHVLNNDIMNLTYDIGHWEQISGEIDNSEEIEELETEIEKLHLDANEADEQLEELHELIDELYEKIDELKSEEWNSQEVFQWYIVDWSGADILKQINEIVYYNEALDMYLWGVTHYGTSWDYVLTDIPLNCKD